MQEGCLFLTVERQFSPVQSTSFNQEVLVENTRKDTSRKSSEWKTSYRAFVQEVSLVNLDNFEVGSPLKKMVSME